MNYKTLSQIGGFFIYIFKGFKTPYYDCVNDNPLVSFVTGTIVTLGIMFILIQFTNLFE